MDIKIVYCTSTNFYILQVIWNISFCFYIYSDEMRIDDFAIKEVWRYL